MRSSGVSAGRRSGIRRRKVIKGIAMKLKSKINVALLISSLICTLVCVGCGSANVINVLKMHNVDAALLNDYKIVCDIKGETFTGRAPSYGVLVFESQPTAFLQSFSTDKTEGFSSEKNEAFENLIDSSFSSLKISNEYRSDWNEKYTWFVSGGFERANYSDTLFMIYFTDDLKLIVCESGH